MNSTQLKLSFLSFEKFANKSQTLDIECLKAPEVLNETTPASTETTNIPINSMTTGSMILTTAVADIIKTTQKVRIYENQQVYSFLSQKHQIQMWTPK